MAWTSLAAATSVRRVDEVADEDDRRRLAAGWIERRRRQRGGERNHAKPLVRDDLAERDAITLGERHDGVGARKHAALEALPGQRVRRHERTSGSARGSRGLRCGCRPGLVLGQDGRDPVSRRADRQVLAHDVELRLHDVGPPRRNERVDPPGELLAPGVGDPHRPAIRKRAGEPRTTAPALGPRVTDALLHEFLDQVATRDQSLVGRRVVPAP